MDRAKHMTKNIKFAVAGEVLLAVGNLVSRRAFILLLGKEYLGINSLFTDVLSMLSLAELGFSGSITYSLYRPVAQGNTEIVKSLMRLYRRVYRLIGLLILALGLCLTPFLGFFIKEMPENISNIPLIYVLTLINASVSYFFSYKSTLLLVNQKKYIETAIRVTVTLLAISVQIIVLLLTRNYIYYLFLSIGATVIQNSLISVKTDKLYPCRREKDIRPLPKETLEEISRNVRALLIHRIGSVAVFNTDNLLISKFVGIATAGLYSNYMMIRRFLNIMTGALFDAITPVLGNMAATETEKRKQNAFSQLDFFSAWLFGWMSICLFCLYDPFIDIWLGRGYLLSGPAVMLIVANFYVTNMRTPVLNMKSVLGLFWDDRYKAILEAVFNLVISIILARKWGIEGIMTGTLISTLALPFWFEPWILYRRGLNMVLRKYFIRYMKYLAVTVAVGTITWLLCRMTRGDIGGFLLKAVICGVVPNIGYLIAYRRTEEFRFFSFLFTSLL